MKRNPLVRKAMSAFLALAMVLSMIPSMAFAAETTVEIGTAEDLKAFANAVNAGDTYAGRTVKLTANITLSGEWTPIGNGTRSGNSYTGNAFEGIFDGGDNTISGLTISQTTGADVALGLFGVVDGGTVKNLKLVAVNINVSSSELAGGAIGILTGEGTADNITVSGLVNANHGNGGIVGRMLISGIINKCTNNAAITATGTNAGGIVGAAYYTATGKTMTISGCTNNGTVESTSGVVGGIAGLSAANVSDCTNTAAVKSNGYSVGGIIGEQQNYGSIIGCTNSAAVTVTADSSNYGTGGIVGWIRYSGSDENYPLKGVVEVKNNSNSGSVSGANDAGGIVGTVYHAANVTGNTNTAASLSATNFAAGIVANFQNVDSEYGGTIPAEELNLSNNISTTTIENISANCKNLYAYDNSSGTQDGVIEDNFGASTKTYEELVAALEAGKDVILTGNIVAPDKAVLTISNQVLDLGGYSLTLNGESGTLTDSTIQNGTIEITTYEGDTVADGMFNVEGTKSTVDNVKFHSDKFALYAIFDLKSGELVMNSCEIDMANNTVGGDGGLFFDNYEKGAATKLTMNSCTVTGTDVGDFIANGTAVLNDCTVTLKGTVENGLDNGINGTALTLNNTNVTIDGATGRGITTDGDDIAINGTSNVTLTKCAEGGIRYKASAAITVEETASLSGTVKVDAAATAAKINDTTVDVTGDELPTATVENGTVSVVEAGTVATVNGTGYATFDEAITEANKLTGDVTVEIYGKVEYADTTPNLTGAYDSISFVGKTDDAEISITRDGFNGYISGVDNDCTVNFSDLKLSKPTGAFATDAGFMNVAFSVYRVGAVNYTNCTFPNGACAAGLATTYTECTFNKSNEKYALWAYGADVTVDNCVFDCDRGIKMYAEGAAKTTAITVTDSDFSKLTGKPAIVLTYGESVTLKNNKYSNTGVFELDKDGDPNGTAVTADIADIACMNDSYTDCGVLVDGKIYTTVTDAAAVATSGSTVTLMYDAIESVELAEGVKLNKNGYTAENVTVATAQPTGTIEKAYISANYNESGVPVVYGEATDVVGTKSFVVELYSGETLVGTAALVDNDKVLLNGASKTITWHAALTNDGDTWWNTTWTNDGINVNAIPDKAVLYVDDVKVSTCAVELNEADDKYPVFAAVTDEDGNVTSFVAGDGYANGSGTNAPVYDDALKTALTAGGNITLLRDVALNNTVKVSSENALTLNGNGHKISGTGRLWLLNSTYDIKDVVFDGINSSDNYGVLEFTNAKANVTGCTFSNNNAPSCIAVDTNTDNGTSVVTIDGCDFTGNTCSTGVINSADGTTTVKNSTITDNNAGIAVIYNSTDITVTGNSFSGNTLTGTNANKAVVLTGPWVAGEYTVSITENAFLDVDYKAVWVEDWADEYGASSTNDLNNNYWNGGEPNYGVTNAPKVTLDYYYTTYENGTLDGLKEVPVTGLSGSGTEEDPYLISDIDELKWFRDDVNAGNTYAGKYVKLTDGINLDKEEWTPIGTSSNTFNGMFDGGSNTISNLTINWSKEYVSGGDNKNYAGLFGYMKGGNTAGIKNLTVENASVTGCLYVGVILGRSYTGGIIENCHVTGDIKVDGYSYIGGIVGRHDYSKGASADGKSMAIYKCSVVDTTTDGGTINADYAVSYVGGIVGFIGEGDYVIDSCDVKNINVSGTYGVGGISGIAHYGNTISKASVETVTVTSTGNDSTSARTDNVGLIAGACQGKDSSPSVITNVTVKETTGSVTYTDETVETISNLYGNNMNGSEAVTNYVARIGSTVYESLAEALSAAQDGETIKLIAGENTVVAMNGAVYGKTVTITGKATVDWSGDNLYVGRGGAGDGKVIFDNANLTSASNQASTGIHVSGREKDTTNKYNGTLEIKNSTIELDYLINRGAITVDNSTLTVKNGFGIAGRPASETESGEAATATIDIINGSYVKVLNHNGMGVGTASSIAEGYGVLNLTNSTFECASFNVDGELGTFNVYGTSTVDIDELTGDNQILLRDGSTLSNSTIGGDVFVFGNVTFSGDNAVAMLYDFGELINNYGADANMKWTVEKDGSLTISNTARYGLGYGDNVTIYGSLEDARNARETLTQDDAAFFTHGLVAQESSSWNKNSSFTVKDAYVIIGSNNSFGNKAGNYGGNYTFNFENAVLDASRITFYEVNSKTVFSFVDSDVKVGTFMTRDADSVFTLTNTKLLSTTETNGTDEGNYHAGTLTLNSSSLTYSAPLVMENGTLTLGAGSSLTAPEITGTGKIVIDATAAAEGTVFIDQTGENAASLENLVTVNNVPTGYEVSYENGDVTIVKSAAEEVELFNIYAANIKMGSDLTMYFYVKKADLVGTDYYAVVTKTYADGRADVVKTIKYADWENYESDETLIRFGFEGIAAKEMADTINVAIYDAAGNQVNNEYKDSIRAYAMRGMDSGNAEIKTMMVDILNYGAEAQTYFEYNTNDLANKLLTDEQKAFATGEIELKNNQVKGEHQAGSTLTFADKVEMTMYFKDLTDGMYAVFTYTDSYGHDYTVKVNDMVTGYGYKGFKLDQLAAADYKQIVTCIVYKADGSVYDTAKDSMESYAVRAKGNEVEELSVSAMKYGASAYAYLH